MRSCFLPSSWKVIFIKLLMTLPRMFRGVELVWWCGGVLACWCVWCVACVGMGHKREISNVELIER